MVRLVGGAYELERPVGRGPHGTVWHARDSRTRQQVAVKVLNPVLAGDPYVVHRFVRDESVLKAFLHEGYVRLQRLIVDEDVALVTELVRGVDLETGLRRCGRLPLPTAVGVAAECARILAAGHRVGVVHGDVKPRNLLLVGKDQQVRITDCRVARLARGRAGRPRPCADPKYAAPEVILNHPPVPATDVYGIGLLLFTMLTGVAQWDGADAGCLSRGPGYYHRLDRDVSDGRLRSILDACLAEDPQHRPSSADLAGDLTAVLDTSPGGPPLEVPRTAPPEEPALGVPRPADEPAHNATNHSAIRGHSDRRTVTPNRRILQVCVAAAALALSGATWLGLSRHHDPHAADAVGPSAAASPTTRSSILAASVAPPQLSGDARGETADGARLAGRYWFDTLNYAMATGDTDLLRAASGSACDACSALEQTITDAYRAGGRIRGGQYVIRSLNPDGFFNLKRATFRVVFDRGTRTTVDKTGQESSTLAGAAFAPCQVILEFENGRWRMVAVQAPSPIG